MIATDRVKILIGKLTNKIVPRKAPIPPPNANEKVKKRDWDLQYGCVTQSGRLVCGNRYK